MNIDIKWVEGKSPTLLMTYSDGWTWDEHFAAQERAKRMVDSADGQVSVIVDLSNVLTPPERVLVQLPEIARYTLSTQTKQLVVVGLHGILETAARVYARAYHRLITVDTLDEALTYLRGC
jgi:hypothetical protein